MKKMLISLGLKLFGGFFRNKIITIRSGLGRGFKRRFGAGYRPKLDVAKEEEFLMNLDYEGKTIYDIGGYIGIFAMFFGQRTGVNGICYSIEPNPANIEELSYHLRLNGIKNVHAFNIGLGTESREMDLVLDPLYPARGSLAKDTSEGKTIKVKIVPLDEFVREKNLRPPDFVKMDVEGFEMEVLGGMARTIKRYKPTMFIEIHGLLSKDIVRFLLNHGYTNLYHVEEEKDIKSLDFSQIYGGHIFCT